MFQKSSQDGFIQVFEGIHRKTLVYGDKTLMTEFRLEAKHDLPRHSHEHEQTGVLVSGRIVLIIGDGEFETLPGDSWCVPSNMEHGARILEDSVAVEVFAPVREDYLPD